MDKKTFDSISPQLLFDGIDKCNLSMAAHYNSALELAKSKLWGIANAHLILSAEEGIKSIILLFKLLRIYDPPESIIKSLFNKHEVKHKLGRDFYKFFLATNNFCMGYLIAEREKISKIDNWLIEINDLTIESMFNIISDDAKNYTDESLEQIVKWWNKATHKKNDGFYTNFIDNKSWKGPEIILQKDYEESLEIIQPILSMPIVFFKIYRKLWIKEFAQKINLDKALGKNIENKK